MAKAKKTAAPKADPNMGNDPVEVVRKPVKERGSDLLTRIYNEGDMYLTQEEAEGIIATGDAKVDLNDTQGNTALVTLTLQGAGLVAPSLKSADTKENKPMTFEIESNIPLPEKTAKRGGKKGSKYPFDLLEVGQSFHVPVTEAMKNPVSALASSLTGARRRFQTPMIDENGQPVMTAATEKHPAKQKMINNRDYTVVAVDATDPKGPGARVFRTR